MAKVILYDDVDGSHELAIKVSIQDCYNWGGFGVCDYCNEEASDCLYLCPELGSYAYCEKCFMEHQGRVKLYQEDIPYIISSLKRFVSSYGLSFEKSDLDKINAYIGYLEEGSNV